MVSLELQAARPSKGPFLTVRVLSLGGKVEKD